MTSLAELQRWIRWAVTDPRGPRQAMDRGPVPEAWQTSARFLEPEPRRLDVVVDAPPMTRFDRLGVYADAYFIRLLGCLESDFAAVRRAVGPEAFKRLAADYLLPHPSTSPHVGDLGAALPSFLRSHALTASHPYLPDLARLETLALESIYSTRLDPMDSARLREIPEGDWPSARFVLDPTLRLYGSAWPIDRLWQDRKRAQGQGRMQLRRPSRRWLVIVRDASWVQVLPIDGPQWFALDRLKEGRTLGELCEELAIQYKEEAQRLPLMQWFGDWVRQGIVKDIRLTDH